MFPKKNLPFFGNDCIVIRRIIFIICIFTKKYKIVIFKLIFYFFILNNLVKLLSSRVLKFKKNKNLINSTKKSDKKLRKMVTEVELAQIKRPQFNMLYKYNFLMF